MVHVMGYNGFCLEGLSYKNMAPLGQISPTVFGGCFHILIPFDAILAVGW